jgi:cation diffusion facilitator CzcD-associated flavoprotein CzcO
LFGGSALAEIDAVPGRRDLKVVIVGAGVGGIAARDRAAEARLSAILDRTAELDETWYHNHYPGSACDVPSHLYSFSQEAVSDGSSRLPGLPV